jgi:hypothetical protein
VEAAESRAVPRAAAQRNFTDPDALPLPSLGGSRFIELSGDNYRSRVTFGTLER